MTGLLPGPIAPARISHDDGLVPPKVSLVIEDMPRRQWISSLKQLRIMRIPLHMLVIEGPMLSFFCQGDRVQVRRDIKVTAE